MEQRAGDRRALVNFSLIAFCSKAPTCLASLALPPLAPALGAGAMGSEFFIWRARRLFRRRSRGRALQTHDNQSRGFQESSTQVQSHAAQVMGLPWQMADLVVQGSWTMPHSLAQRASRMAAQSSICRRSPAASMRTRLADCPSVAEWILHVPDATQPPLMTMLQLGCAAVKLQAAACFSGQGTRWADLSQSTAEQ